MPKQVVRSSTSSDLDSMMQEHPVFMIFICKSLSHKYYRHQNVEFPLNLLNNQCRTSIHDSSYIYPRPFPPNKHHLSHFSDSQFHTLILHTVIAIMPLDFSETNSSFSIGIKALSPATTTAKEPTAP